MTTKRDFESQSTPADASDAGCELCGEWAEFAAVPIWPEAGSPPPQDLTRVALCASCLAGGVPPGWHILEHPLPLASTKERAEFTLHLDLPSTTYRWNLWRRDDGTTFLSLGHPRDPVERETLVRSFDAENWLTAEQEAFGTTSEIDRMLAPLIDVLHQFPRVLVTHAKLGLTENGQRHAAIGLTIDTVKCLRRLLRAMAAIRPRHHAIPWELAVDANEEWMRKLPPNGMALTLKLCLTEATLASLAGFVDDLSEQTPMPELGRHLR